MPRLTAPHLGAALQPRSIPNPPKLFCVGCSASILRHSTTTHTRDIRLPIFGEIMSILSNRESAIPVTSHPETEQS